MRCCASPVNAHIKMKVRLIKHVVIGGHPGVQVGDEFEAKEAAALIASGYCVAAPEGLVQVAESIVIENRDPVTTPLPQKRTKKT